MINFDEAMFDKSGYNGWSVIETSIINRHIILNDDNPYYQGYIKLKNIQNRKDLAIGVGTYRIAETKDKYGGEYPEIYDTQFRSDQRMIIFFKNPKIEVLGDNEIRIIDFNKAIQDSLIEKHRKNFQRYNFNGVPDFEYKNESNLLNNSKWGEESTNPHQINHSDFDYLTEVNPNYFGKATIAPANSGLTKIPT